MTTRRFPPFKVLPDFYASEFECKCLLCHGGMMAYPMLNVLGRLRMEWNRPLRIVSGLRCERWNAMKGGTKGSLHCEGMAVDLAGEGIHSVEFVELAILCGAGGIGQGEGPWGRILHLDARDRSRATSPMDHIYLPAIGAIYPPEAWSYTAPGKRVPGNALVDAAWKRVAARVNG